MKVLVKEIKWNIRQKNRNKEQRWKKGENGKVADLNPNISVVTLKVNVLNTLIQWQYCHTE